MTTADGSITIHLPDWNEQYHSKHGAIAEALHVFIGEGLHYYLNTYSNRPIHLLEMGFGTGLNALLTIKEAETRQTKVHYTGIEAYPVSMEEIQELNYTNKVKTDETWFQSLHQAEWGQKSDVGNYFSICKEKKQFEALQYENQFHLIYFDAFGARVQPELWTEAIFQFIIY